MLCSVVTVFVASNDFHKAIPVFATVKASYFLYIFAFTWLQHSEVKLICHYNCGLIGRLVLSVDVG